MGELRSLPPAGVGVPKKFLEIYSPVVETARMRALLQPIAATGEKWPENHSLPTGVGRVS